MCAEVQSVALVWLLEGVEAGSSVAQWRLAKPRETAQPEQQPVTTAAIKHNVLHATPRT